MNKETISEAEFDEKYLAITSRQRPVLIRFLRGDTDAEIATKLGFTEANVRQHIKTVCRLFNIQNEKGESWRLRQHLVEIFIQYKPELVAKRCLDKWPELQPTIIFPSGAVSLDSFLYIERGPIKPSIKRSIEADIKAAIIEPRALIRIIAPSKFGKTSLLLRIEAHAKTQNFRTVFINIKQEFDRERLED